MRPLVARPAGRATSKEVRRAKKSMRASAHAALCECARARRVRMVQEHAWRRTRDRAACSAACSRPGDREAAVVEQKGERAAHWKTGIPEYREPEKRCGNLGGGRDAPRRWQWRERWSRCVPVRSVSAVTGAMGILVVVNGWVLGTARALSW